MATSPPRAAPRNVDVCDDDEAIDNFGESDSEHQDDESADGQDWDMGRKLSDVSVSRAETGAQVRLSGINISEHLATTAAQPAPRSKKPLLKVKVQQNINNATRLVRGFFPKRMSAPAVSPAAQDQKLPPILPISPAAAAAAEAEAEVPCGRRNSQLNFAAPAQSIIIFDWDDTLFPRTYLKDDRTLVMNVPLDDQRMPLVSKNKLGQDLEQCAAQACKILTLAVKLGRVILVTLARNPWVTDSCRNFFPGVAETIEALGIEIVYAQAGMQIDYRKVNMMADEQIDEFWSGVKSKSIAKVVEKFYTQYQGQTWKNIISIGDSHFERRGTITATINYAKQRGLILQDSTPLASSASPSSWLTSWSPKARVPTPTHSNSQDMLLTSQPDLTKSSSVVGIVDDHEYKIRVKTFKMLDEPSLQELVLQLGLIRKWIPKMVSLDDGFDIDLNSLEDPKLITAIEAKFEGKP